MTISRRFGMAALFGPLAIGLLAILCHGVYDRVSYLNLPSRSQANIEKTITKGMSKAKVNSILGEPDNIDHGGGWMYDNRASSEYPNAPDTIVVAFKEDLVEHILFMRHD